MPCPASHRLLTCRLRTCIRRCATHCLATASGYDRLLCVAAAESVGGMAEQVLPTACALEMIHTFSLIHDDLPALDNDDLRRGVPTSHKQFGEAMAILAGDALHTLAFSTIAAAQEGDPVQVVKVIRLVAEACGEAGMVGGQVDDMYYEKRNDVTPDILRSIHARKTGALLTVSILSGAILCGATDAQEGDPSHVWR